MDIPARCCRELRRLCRHCHDIAALVLPPEADFHLHLARGTVRRERPADRQFLFHCVATDWCILSVVPGRRGIAIGSL